MLIKVKRGLDVPIRGKPRPVFFQAPRPRQVSLNLEAFDDVKFKTLVKTGDAVKTGQPLAENKTIPNQMFVSPGCGTVVNLRRGNKRSLLDIVIELSDVEEHFINPTLDLSSAGRDELIRYLLTSGIFPHIRMRPFNLIANPKHIPENIFISAIEQLPFTPPAEMQIEGFESYFQSGLEVCSKLTSGQVHLVYSKDTHCKTLTHAQNVVHHTVTGPYPASTHSVHIEKIAPILSSNQIVWTMSALSVIVIGKMIQTGKYHTARVISVAGEGIIEEKRGYVRGRMGQSILELTSNCMDGNRQVRIISGDPLTGNASEPDGYLNFFHTSIAVIPESKGRQAFHFLRLGWKKFTATRTYASGHRKPPQDGYSFTTNQHGELRAFIDGSVYDKVMPLRISTIHLIKAILAENYELAEQLGLLAVSSEDFALATFICPSKIEMMEIVRKGLLHYARELGY